jgi:hypothetical protein
LIVLWLTWHLRQSKITVETDPYLPIGFSNSFYARAAEEANSEEGADVLEGEEEANVEEGDVLKTGEGEEEEDTESVHLKPSPDIDSFFLFTDLPQTTLGLISNFICS